MVGSGDRAGCAGRAQLPPCCEGDRVGVVDSCAIRVGRHEGELASLRGDQLIPPVKGGLTRGGSGKRGREREGVRGVITLR